MSTPSEAAREIDRRLLRRRTCVAFRDIRALAEQAVRDALAATTPPDPVVADLAAGPAPCLLAALDPKPDVVLELGLYGIYHEDARIERHSADLAELVAPEQVVVNVRTGNREIDYVARVWINAAGERCVWRLRPVEQIVGYAAAAGHTPASITADRFGIHRVVRLMRAEKTA
jgi:hypothetical protein